MLLFYCYRLSIIVIIYSVANNYYFIMMFFLLLREDDDDEEMVHVIGIVTTLQTPSRGSERWVIALSLQPFA